ncbi:transcription termination/antitermination protein NusG [Brevibacterium casei]
MSDTSSPEQDAPETQVDAPETETVEESTTEATADVESTAAEETSAAPAEESAETPEAIESTETTVEETGEVADAVDPAEEFKSELRMQEGDWYVIHSYAGYENRVKQNLENRAVSLNLEDFIFESQVPMEDVVEIKNGQRKQVRRVRVPGYVLVRMELTDESWGAVRHTPGVTGFVGNAYDPVPLSIDEVFTMLAPVFEERQAEAAAAEGVAAEAAAKSAPITEVEFEVGESVLVKEGSFEGHPATIQEIRPDSQKLTVLLSIFERDVPVELGFDQVSKL